MHRVEHASPSSPHPASSSTDSSLYSDSSDTTASAEFVLGQSTSALPRISVMEDYTVYRDLSHIGHHGPPEDYFSFSQLPAELQGRLVIDKTLALDSGNYSCLPSYATPDWVMVHIVTGQNTRGKHEEYKCNNSVAV